MRAAFKLTAIFFTGLAVFALINDLEAGFWASLVISNVYWVGSRLAAAIEQGAR